jgi:hypothetical protein
MKRYKIPISRTLYGFSHVEADNLEDAIEVAPLKTKNTLSVRL